MRPLTSIRGEPRGEINGFPILRVKVSDLQAAPYNPRKISEAALNGLRASVDEFGLPEPIVWNKRSQTLVGGHSRAKTLDPDSFTDVVVVDLDPDRERALNVALNNPHIAGEWTSGLKEILDRLDASMPQLSTDLKFGDLTKYTE